MALDTAPATRGRLPGSTGLSGRGRPQMVRATTAVAVIVEAQAFARDVIDDCAGIQTLAATGTRQQIAHQAGRLGHTATTYLKEFRRLALEVEE